MGVTRPDGVTLPEGVPRLSPSCSSGVRLCTTTTGGGTAVDTGVLTGGTERVVVGGVELIWEGGVTPGVGACTYIGTDEIGLPMAGAGAGVGERDLLAI